jgi:hypothetical protein
MNGLFQKLFGNVGAPNVLDRVSADPLDQVLVCFGDQHPDFWTVRHACQGTQIFGSTGSGKTSGSGRLLAHAFLRSGFGGLVLTCKPDECETWKDYCRETGRIDDLIIFSPAQPWRFNFMQYEFCRAGAGSRNTENLVRLFGTLAEVAERKSASSGPDYWSRAMNQLVRNAVELASIARGVPTLDLVAQIVSTAPQSLEDVSSPDWQDSSVCFRCIQEGDPLPKNELQAADWPQVVRFWINEFPSLSPRTRSCIVSMFTTLAEQFLRGEIRKLFCSEINIDPDVTFQDHKIIVVDLPVKGFSEVGVLAQVLWKQVWQRAAERRNIQAHPTPTFLWADESQHFITKYDATFQMTSRSARAMTVYLTQSLPNYYALMSRHETDSLLANLATRIWHRNSCVVTNAAAAETIAKSRQYRWSSGTSLSEGFDGAQRTSRNTGGSDSVEHQLLPGFFQSLRSGGAENDLLVDAVVFENGRIWSTGKNFLKATFSQHVD